MIFKKRILILIFFLIVLYPGYIRNQECEIPPPPGPPADNADDNYSFNLKGNQSVNIPPYIEEFPSVGIFNNGNVEKMANLLNKFGISYIYVDADFNPEILLNHVKTLIISTGGLIGKSSNLKLLLEQFVAWGGTIICLAQQDSGDYEVLPIPEGEYLKAFGWRNTQSCTWGSVYFEKENMHPILSAMTNERVSMPVDAYFPNSPANTTVLLRRVANNEPALLYYKLGEYSFRSFKGQAIFLLLIFASGFRKTDELDFFLIFFVDYFIRLCHNEIPFLNNGFQK